MKNWRIACMALLLPVCLPLSASDKKDLEERYKGKYLLVLREGLAVGVCEGLPAVPAGNSFDVRVTGDSVDFARQAGAGTGITGCGEMLPEPLHKGVSGPV